MGFSLSMFDPTSRNSAFGGFVRQGLAAVPGGSQALSAVDAFNRARRPTDRSGTTDRGGGAAPAGSAPSLGSRWSSFATKPLVVVGAGVAVVAVVALLAVRLFRRR